MERVITSDEWVHRFTRRLRTRLPIGMNEALMICVELFRSSGDLIPEQVADDYVDKVERAGT